MIKKKLIEKVCEEQIICNALREYHKKHLERAINLRGMHGKYFEEEFSSFETELFKLEQKHRQLLVKYTRKLK